MLVIQDPLLYRIDSRRAFIENILDMYPTMMDKSNRLLLDRFEKEALNATKGDSELESSILSSMLTAFDNDGFIYDEFYKSILLVSFSYCESTLRIINKDLTPSTIELLTYFPISIINVTRDDS